MDTANGNQVFGCYYLAESEKSIKLASKYFSALYEEDTDAFLTMHHKAWNALWQADLIYSGMNIRKPNNFVYGIEGVINTTNFHEGEIPHGYNPSRTLAFEDLQTGNPFHSNLMFFKTLRNQSVHEFLSTNKLRNFVTPYLRASFYNYLHRYDLLINEVKSGRNLTERSCHNLGEAHDCKIKSLSSLLEMKYHLVIPTTMYSTELERDESALSSEAQETLDERTYRVLEKVIEQGYDNERQDRGENTQNRFFLAHSHVTHTLSVKKSNIRFQYNHDDVINLLNKDAEFPFIFTREIFDKIVQKHLVTKMINDGDLKVKEIIRGGRILVNRKSKTAEKGIPISDLCKNMKYISSITEEQETGFFFSEDLISLLKEKSKDIRGVPSAGLFAEFAGVLERSIRIK